MGLFDLFSSGNERAARDSLIGGMNRGRRRAFGSLNEGEADLREQYGNASALFDPLAETYGRGSRAYADALGLYGDEGVASAQNRFQTGPGYNFAMDQGNQAILRSAASRGALAGGGTSADLVQFSQGLANQEWGDYLDRLAGYDPLAMSAAGSQAGIATGLGDRLLGLAGDRAGINWAAETGAGKARSDYNLSKDATGANIFNAITGGLSLGSKLLGMF